MTLIEMSEDYKAAAELLRQRLSQLRRELAKATDPDEIWHIKRRIAALEPMLTQMNELSWLLANYYERGGADRDDRYGLCGKRIPRKIKRKEDDNTEKDLKLRINRITAAGICGLSFRRENDPADSGGAWSEQKHSLQDTSACREEGSALHEVFGVDGFFPRHSKKKRRK